MLRRDASVVFLPSWVDACALWRLYMPYASMDNTSFFAFKTPIFELIVDKDIAVVQRCYNQGQLNFIKACKDAGMKVIMDLDDDVWHIPPHNPSYEMLTKYKHGFVECMQLVNVVTVSTKPLARIVQSLMKRHKVPVVIAENRINSKLFALPKKNADITVGWAGSNSHQGVAGQPGTGDLGVIESAIKFISRHYAGVRFEFRGGEPIEEILQLPNVRHYGGVPIAEYAHRMPMWGWHIALAPVTTDEFNRSKSCIKMVEAGYCGIPCLATRIEPYERFCSFDSDLRWLLCSKEADWINKLRDLINDQDMRAALGQKMNEVTTRYFSFDKPHEGWQAAFNKAMDSRL